MSHTPRVALLYGLNTSGGLIYGYNSGVIAGALDLVGATFPLNAIMKGILTCSLLVGAFFGCMVGGVVANKLGRRTSTVIAGVISLLAPVASSFSNSLPLLCVLRGVLGIGLGLAAVVVPLYVSEGAPSDKRGVLGTIFQLAITTGILLGYVAAIIFDDVTHGWRYMFGIGAVPGLLLLLHTPIMPESQQWLAGRSLDGEAAMLINSPDSKGNKFGDLLLPVNRRAFWVGILLCITQQLTGINAFMYFSPAIFTAAGFSSPLLATIGLGAWNVITTLIGTFFVERLGRRPLILGGTIVMAVSSTLLGLAYIFIKGSAVGIISVILLLIFVAGFEAGDGPLFWVVANEIFDPSVREAGASIMNATTWICNLALSLSFLPATQALGNAPPMLFFGGLGFVCVALLWAFLPETKGKADKY